MLLFKPVRAADLPEPVKEYIRDHAVHKQNGLFNLQHSTPSKLQESRWVKQIFICNNHRQWWASEKHYE